MPFQKMQGWKTSFLQMTGMALFRSDYLRFQSDRAIPLQKGECLKAIGKALM